LVYFLTERMRLSLSLHPQLSVIPHEKQDRETDTDDKNADPASGSVPFIAVIAAEAASENEP
jgi:hypothetical protein